jgi:hypothetical protein
MVEAERGPATPRIEVPGAAAYNFILYILASSPGTAIGRGSVIVAMPDVLAPFPHIAVHVTEAKGISDAKVIHRRQVFFID